MASERYGGMVHKHMESKDMAPKYYNTCNVVTEIPYVDQKPIEFYHVMETLLHLRMVLQAGCLFLTLKNNTDVQL